MRFASVSSSTPLVRHGARRGQRGRRSIHNIASASMHSWRCMHGAPSLACAYLPASLSPDSTPSRPSAVVAVARKGERIRANPGDVCVQPGDILLLDTGAAFAEQHKASRGTAGQGAGNNLNCSPASSLSLPVSSFHFWSAGRQAPPASLPAPLVTPRVLFCQRNGDPLAGMVAGLQALLHHHRTAQHQPTSLPAHWNCDCVDCLRVHSLRPGGEPNVEGLNTGSLGLLPGSRQGSDHAWPACQIACAHPARKLPPICAAARTHNPTPQVLDILPGAAIVVGIMLLTGCMSPEQARRAIRWVSAQRLLTCLLACLLAACLAALGRLCCRAPYPRMHSCRSDAKLQDLLSCDPSGSAPSVCSWLYPPQDVYLMIAGSFGVSAALEQSGGAAAIANLIVNIGKNAGGGELAACSPGPALQLQVGQDARASRALLRVDRLVTQNGSTTAAGNFTIAAVYVATTLLSQIIANNSAAGDQSALGVWSVTRLQQPARTPSSLPVCTLEASPVSRPRICATSSPTCSPDVPHCCDHQQERQRRHLPALLLHHAGRQLRVHVQLWLPGGRLLKHAWQWEQRAACQLKLASELPLSLDEQGPWPVRLGGKDRTVRSQAAALKIDPACPAAAACLAQTNLMALAAGGHSSRDFLKFGTPMQLVLVSRSQAWGLL